MGRRGKTSARAARRTEVMAARRRRAGGAGRCLGVLAMVAAFAGAAAAADTVATEPGRRLAERWCDECHVPGAPVKGQAGVAPSFRAVANDPATTERSVRVFLRSPHPTMPNVSLTREQIDDLVTYILGLKER